jgi:hypothetical protein
MTNPAGDSTGEIFRLDFDRRLMLQFRGAVVTSDAGFARLPGTRRRARSDRDGRRQALGRKDRQEWSARSHRNVAAVRVWPPCRLRGCERRRTAASSSGDALDRIDRRR